MSFRVILTIVFVMFETLPLDAWADDCGLEGSSAWAGCQSLKSFEIVDKELNATYRRLTSAMDKREWRETRAKLLSSQRAWISFRDKECAFAQELSGGANKAPGLDCQTDMTKERTAYLQRVLEQLKSRDHAP